ncbi:MAG: hypothetical protein HZC40_17195 [Chloroflexi bacterium]|nr:hypothetical protein [Chloroflexota bacterium]
MIWVEFQERDAALNALKTNVFETSGAIVVQVNTRPPVIGLRIEGMVQKNKSDLVSNLNFEPGDAPGIYRAPFQLVEPGAYTARISATKDGYRAFSTVEVFYGSWVTEHGHG